MRRTIDDIVETLRMAKERGRGCSLLVGAGCSVKAGIPTAAGFVDVIKERYPRAYKRAEPKTYARCMGQLMLSEQRDLIGEYVDNAKINWAHVCIAQLLQAGYVDRVLTTNFDLLVTRACGLLCEFPATYDFAVSQLFKPADIPEKAVIYLHGQRSGFALMNTDEDLKRHSKLLGPVFEDAGRGRVWIVVGYSGENDPVFDHLAKVPRFDNGLYWVGYQNDPAPHVSERLLDQGKDAFFTGGFDADSFFISLNQQLGIFPPALVARPFSHIDQTMKMLTPYTPPGHTGEEDVIAVPRKWIDSAIRRFERGPNELLTQASDPGSDVGALLAAAAQGFLMAGSYDKAIALRPNYDEHPSEEFADALYSAYVQKGTQLAERAKSRSPAVARRLFRQGSLNYELATDLRPHMALSLVRWGKLLVHEAERSGQRKAKRLLEEADQRLRVAHENSPDDAELSVTWGVALLELSIMSDGAQAKHLFTQATANFSLAHKLDPRATSGLTQWGIELVQEGKTRTADSAAAFFSAAERKFQTHESLAPGEGAYNIACARALLGDSQGCRSWLTKAITPRREGWLNLMLSDEDLLSVRNSQWFKDLASSIKAKPTVQSTHGSRKAR